MASPEPMFDPRSYDGIRKPAIEAWTLPPHCYTAPEFYRAEAKHLFMKVWNFIGRADRIPKAGDYFAVDYVGVPIIVLRGQDGAVRAFANSCRHRGARLVDAPRGEGLERLRCPYHAWTYALDGRLVGAPHMQEAVDFDKAEYPLHEAAVAEWEGFLFVNPA